MADISKIKLPDGNTYNIKDTVSGYTTNTGTVTSITIKGTSPIISSSSSAITGSGTRTISHDTSGATAGSYGDSSAQTPTYGGTFKVPYVTVDTYGHVTSISDHTVTIPASDNTDENVLQSVLIDTDTHWRKVAFGFYDSTKPATTATEQTNKIWVSNKLEYQASKGMLSVGISDDNGVFPNGGIKCHDVRDVTTVSSQEGANFIMTNNNLSGWWSGLHFKSSGGTYAAWELVGYANNGDGTTQPLYVRTSNKTTAWGDWRKIYDSANPPTASDVGALASTTKYALSNSVGGDALNSAKVGGYTIGTTSVGSASTGTAITADDITSWTTNTPTTVTKKTVVTSASGATASYANGILTLTDGAFDTGDSCTVTAGTAATLKYTPRSIPNISVTSTTVATATLS